MIKLHKINIIIFILSIISSIAIANPLSVTGTKSQEESNRMLVINFYNTFFNKHQVDIAAQSLADNYKQHNPSVPDGKIPFVSFFKDFFEKNSESKAKIIRSAVDGDIVWLHVHSTNNNEDRGEAVVDIFRVKNGKS